MRQALNQTGRWVRDQQSNEAWKSERDIWAVGLLLTGLVTWMDWHPPEGLTLAVAYLTIRGIQILRRKLG